VPFAFKDRVKKELNRLEKDGVIKLVDNNDWGTQLVPVLKGNGKIRLCGDYKTTVNRCLEDVNHPLPKVEELFIALQGGKIFSKIDFKNAYNQLLLDEETSKVLAWSTHKGIYIINHLPYGTKPACAIFQKIVEETLSGLKGTMNFLDDVIVTGRLDEEHTMNLKNVLVRLKYAGFKVNLNKCSFFQKEICYSGHIINEEGLKKDPAKVQAIVKASRPLDIHGVRAFIGMINYYGRFINNVSSLLEPIYRLLKKGQTFKWTVKFEVAFNKAKQMLASENVLIHYDLLLELRLNCDASNIGIGAVLSSIT